MSDKPFNQPDKPLMELDSFSFAYDSIKRPLLNAVNLELFDREAVLLMGASGSGKSSIALCLNGLYPDAVEGYAKGTIYFRGTDIRTFPKGLLNQQVGIVFQEPESQFCMITVEEELAFTLENLQVPSSEMYSRISETLEQVGMQAYMESAISELSGGQKQKVALAAVLLMKPDFLVLDEPTSNLDPVSSLEFIELINRMQKDYAFSLLVIDHQADDWLSYLDRIVVLGQDGTIKADDPPDVVFTKHREHVEQERLFIPYAYDRFQHMDTPHPEPLPDGDVYLEVRNLYFHHKSKAVLHGVDLTAKSGSITTVAGENGAGKSTLLQVLGGLLKPVYGQIKLFGKHLQNWPENLFRRHMGYVFQNPEHQFITDTVYDELTFGMYLNRESEQTMEARAKILMDLFQLQSHRYANPFSLSGGQKRRLSTATMLDETPGLLLFDEPTFGQDAGTASILMNKMEQLKQNGTAIILVTHDMDLVDRYSDHIYVLYNKGIAFHGSPSCLWKKKQLLRRARLRLPRRIEQGVQELF